MRLLELTSDTVFKAFMMSEKTNKYKARLIHLITNIPEDELLHATYTSEELPVNNKKDKIYKTDIIVRVNKHIVNIEMNKDYYEGLIIKNGTYTNKLGSEKYEKGQNYLETEQIIQINIDNFHKYKGNKLIYEFMMREKETGEIETNLLKSYHIDLSYLDNIRYNESNELERICLLFKENNKEIQTILRRDNIMDEAYEELERLSSDEKIIGLYDAEKVEQKILNTRLESARLEGKSEGEKNKSIEIAKNLLKQNISIDIIEKATGLIKEQIEELK